MTGRPGRREQRLQWLRDHRDAWRNWHEERDPRKKALVKAMKADGVVAPSTYWPDVRLVPLMQRIRREDHG